MRETFSIVAIYYTSALSQAPIHYGITINKKDAATHHNQVRVTALHQPPKYPSTNFCQKSLVCQRGGMQPCK